MKQIYLAHKYGNDIENLCHAIDLGTALTMANQDVHIFNAVPYFHQFRNVFSEKKIMDRCIEMVSRCDEIWLAPGWTTSKGCNKEYEAARYYEVKVVYLPAERLSGVEG